MTSIGLDAVTCVEINRLRIKANEILYKKNNSPEFLPIVYDIALLVDLAEFRERYIAPRPDFRPLRQLGEESNTY